jgi:hypothetical protein
MARQSLRTSRERVVAIVAFLSIAILVAGCGGSNQSSTDGGVACGPTMSACNGACTETRFDLDNCGGCGVVCPVRSICVDSQCSPIGSSSSATGSGVTGDAGNTVGAPVDSGMGDGSPLNCIYPKQMCGLSCVDTTSDSANCAFCGQACSAGQMCSMSRCVQGCTAPAISCSGKCLDGNSDAVNCGSCGHACAAGQVCNAGACAAPCPNGTTFCGSACANLATDLNNCGGCGIACASGELCAAGLCRGRTSIWPTLGGDIHHTGYNANETGKPPLTAAWNTPIGAVSLWPAVSDGGTIYVTSSATFGSAQLSAVSPVDGHVFWSHNFGDVFSVGQATVAAGHVFVAQCNNSMGTYMYSFAAATGSLDWSQPFGAQWEHYWAPVVVGGHVYFDGGSYGGLYSFDEVNGSQIFFAFEDQWDEWSPLYLDNHVYTFTAGNVRMFDTASGTLVGSTIIPWIWNGYTMNTSAVSDGTSLYVISPPNLVALPPNLGQPLWTANGAYSSQPAIANGVVYSISAGQLRANDATSGALLWSFAGDSMLTHPPVVAAGTVYVASDANVYAVDLATKVQTWANTPGGWLSIAGGQLLVASATGTLVAWSLH